MAADVPEEAADPLVALSPPSPNPFVQRSGLTFSLARPGRALLDICDVTGRHVVTLVDAAFPEGAHEAVWDGRGEDGVPCAAGVYFARLTCEGTGTSCQKIVKLR